MMSTSPQKETEAPADAQAQTIARMPGPAPRRDLMELLLSMAPRQDLPLPDRKPLRRRPL
ncbi:MAG TPA: hypothetical protein VL574_14660 [Stellaceae bacterium]|nr:hypothetical protein [Stellaceae bacterium]